MTSTSTPSKAATSTTTSSSLLSSATKKRNELKLMKKENAAKIRDYAQRIRERNRKKTICRQRAEKVSHRNAKQAHHENVKVIRATPVPENSDRSREHRSQRRFAAKNGGKKNHHPKSKSKQQCNKENEDHTNNDHSQKYEYGNEAVLSWMKKQRRTRAQKQKELERKRQAEIEKRKAYISNLNKAQIKRARKIKEKRQCHSKCSREMKAMREHPPKMRFDDGSQMDMPPTLITIPSAMRSVSMRSSSPSSPSPSPSASRPPSPTPSRSRSRSPSASPSASPVGSPSESAAMSSNASILLDENGEPNPALLLKIYERIKRKQMQRSLNAQTEKQHATEEEEQDDNDEEQTETKKDVDETFNLDMEQRLNMLKHTSCQLQQRLESIAETLHLPQSPPRPLALHTTVDNEVLTQDPHLITRSQTASYDDNEQMECESEMNKMYDIFDKLSQQLQEDHEYSQHTDKLKEVDDDDEEEEEESNILRLYAKDLMYSATASRPTASKTAAAAQTETETKTKKAEAAMMEAQREEALYEKSTSTAITNKLLLELQLLENVQKTASKLEKLQEMELPHITQRNSGPDKSDTQTENANQQETELEKQKTELLQVLQGIKSEIENLETVKQETKELADKQIELIKSTGFEVSKQLLLDSESKRNVIQHETEKQNEKLMELTSHILSSQEAETERKKTETQNLESTLENAMDLLQKYSNTLESHQSKHISSPLAASCLLSPIEAEPQKQTQEDSNETRTYSSFECAQHGDEIDDDDDDDDDHENVRQHEQKADTLETETEVLSSSAASSSSSSSSSIQFEEVETEPATTRTQLEPEQEQGGDTATDTETELENESQGEEEEEEETEESTEIDHESESMHDKADEDKAEMRRKSEIISLNIMSDIVSEIFMDTQQVFELKQKRKLLQHAQESGTDQEHERGQDWIVMDKSYIEQYIETIFKHSNELDWSSKSMKAAQIDLSVFVFVETQLEHNEKQQVFNNLIFDTLNEVLMDLKLRSTNHIQPSQEQIIKIVQEKMSKITMCSSEKQLMRQYFINDAEIDKRIRGIAHEWIHEFETGYEWSSTFSAFNNSIKFQIADQIHQQLICDVVHTLTDLKSRRNN